MAGARRGTWVARAACQGAHAVGRGRLFNEYFSSPPERLAPTAHCRRCSASSSKWVVSQVPRRGLVGLMMVSKPGLMGYISFRTPVTGLKVYTSLIRFTPSPHLHGRGTL